MSIQKKIYFTDREVAERYGVSRPTVWRWLREGKGLDAKQASNEVAFDHKAFASALSKASNNNVDAEDLPITKIEMSVSPLHFDFTAFDKRWTFTDSDKRCVELETHPEHWLISPNGKLAAFTRDHNIWVRDIAAGEERALTQDGEPFYSYASGPSAWGIKNSALTLEAIWSPDTKRLFTLQVDTRKVKTLAMMEYVPTDGNPRSKSFALDRRFALPGDKHIDEYRFLAIEVETGRQQGADYRQCPVFRNAMGYFTRSHQGWWANNGRHAYFIDIERMGDHVARLLEFDTYTGAVRVVIEEESPDVCFKLRLDSRDPIHVRPLPETNEVIWFSERSGWGHLYLYDIETGTLKNPITQGNWVIREIRHIDTEHRELIVQTAGRVEDRDPYYCDICRVGAW